MLILLAIIGAVVGAVSAGGVGALFGGISGLLFGLVQNSGRRLDALRKQLQQLDAALKDHDRRLARVERTLASLTDRDRVPGTFDERTAPQAREAEQPAQAEQPEQPASYDAEEAAGREECLPTPPPGSAQVRHDAPAPSGEVPAATPAYVVRTPVDPARAMPIAKAASLLRNLLFGGNTVVRVGIVVLLVGVTLLLKYAADNDMFPLELRMAAAGLLGLFLVLFGLRQRLARPGFAQTLQGGGVATTYLVVFFSYRTYALLPSGLALLLLVALAAGSAVLAVAQNALPLILIGQAGGFLAPVLASSDSGNHVALFSYYLVLNLAIFFVAFLRAWRPLNLLGFVFTFGIGTAWGALSYAPEKLASTEPFLVAFFVLYVAIPVIFALRHETRGWVDGSLVFGAPLAFLALQLSLVRDIPFAMAYTTLALAALYLGLTRYLQRRAPASLRAMSEAFLALGVGFGTLAVPYGLDNAGLTGATWALEGAGLYWLGVRQSRWLSRAAGVVLQGLGGSALLYHLGSGADSVISVHHTRTLAAALIAFGSFFIARTAHCHRASLKAPEWRGLQVLIGWALLFWLPAGLAEIDAHVARGFEPGAALAFFGATGIALELVGKRLAFGPGRYPAAALIPLLLPVALVFELDLHSHLLSHGGAFGWPVYLAACVLSLRRFVPDPGPRPEAPAQAHPTPGTHRTAFGADVLALLHPMFMVGLAAWLSLVLLRLVRDEAGLAGDWSLSAVGLPPIAFLWLALRSTDRERWPMRSFSDLYRGLGAGVLAVAILLWSLITDLQARGDSAPVAYVPLANPADVAALLGLSGVVAWYLRSTEVPPRSWPAALLPATPAALAAFSFAWFNSMLARSVHQYTGVAFHTRSLWRSVPLQVATSVSWTVIALALTVYASKRTRRTLWMVGTGLLGVVVVKLFLIDLERLSTVAKIGTFLVVGVLLLAMGYFAPVPPRVATGDRHRPPPGTGSGQTGVAERPSPKAAGDEAL